VTGSPRFCFLTERQVGIGSAAGFVIFGGWLALGAQGGLSTTDERWGAAVLGVLAMIFLVVLLWQLLKGPTCVTFLQMRNGLERIASANRLRSSLKMRDRLATLIAASAEAKAFAAATP
jgi:hypothetical protein